MMADIFNHLWQSTLFAAAVALLCVACRYNRARLRYGLWFVASVKFLVPFAALAAVGSVVQWRQAPSLMKSVVASPAVRDLNAPFDVIWLDAATNATAGGSPQWIVPLFLALWACGCVAIILRRVWQWREILGALRASTPFATVRLCQGSGGQALPPGVEIRTAPTVLEPGVVGLRRPVILMPAGIDSYLTADQFAAVVAHEVCHVRRRDSLTAAIHMAVEALFWFHPMVWWIGARLVATREQACDEYVVAHTAEPVAYAEGIVTICQRNVAPPLMSVAGVAGADVKARIDAILANRIGLRLTLKKRLVLATAAVVAIGVPLVAGALKQLVDPEARFEVVSIKRFDSSTAPRISMTPGRYDVAGVPLSLIVGQALGTPADRIFGLPDWVNTELFAIIAKAPDNPPPAAMAMSVMLANLLKDRFSLTTHRETRQLPVYDLVFARTDRRLGPRLKPASPECQAALRARLEGVQRGGPVPLDGDVPENCISAELNPGIVGFSGVPMSMLAQVLTQSVGRPIIDKTGLTGYYDYTLNWTPQPGSVMPFTPAGEPPAAPPAANPDGVNLFTAVQEQLGLKLESSRGPVEVVVIDRLEKPALD
jgi:uncharacterized protein (TIGR03435 family)